MRRLLFLGSSLTVAVAAAAACGNSPDSVFDAGAETPEASTTTPPILPGEGGVGDPDAFTLRIDPPDPVVTFRSGQAKPTVTFQATVAGATVPAAFTIDRGEIGDVALSGGLFTASGNVGGKATITATFNGKAASTSVTVKLALSQNGGPPGGGDAGAPDGGGAGGVGGVGGEGEGAAVDAQTLAVLKSAPVADPNLAWLYPYDRTVWPRGILAPLLQWRPGDQGDYDAVSIKITETNFEYEGFFAKTAAPFSHHPIPALPWKQMATSNAGEDVTVRLVFAKGGVAYGPIVETWKIASAPLKGTVYYNSYGTRLAKNFTGAIGGDGRFGGATLGIRGGSTDPVLVAGGNGDQTYCRVCHSVAANGARLITQRDLGHLQQFSAYDLKTGAETTMAPEGNGADYAWPAIYPDGTAFLGDSSPAPGSSTAPNRFFSAPTGAGPVTPTEIATTGWPDGMRAGLSAFSPDGKRLAFTMVAGAPGADGRTLGVLDFARATNAFSNLTALYTPPNAAHTALYPSFLPSGKGIVFEVETRYNGRDFGGTRSDCDSAGACSNVGARAELWWVDVASKTAARLDKLNGVGYVPTGPEAHDDDATLNYEPTVNPVPSGGYAWVVFTSRRLYGNVGTINPFWSDPRYHDITGTPTTKKLWVAAIDLNAAPGTDPSHPAFYLPAQELLAGNSRGYWVVDPCRNDGSTCESGDECCGGFCRPGPGGQLVCTAQTPACAQEFEKCSVDADCCNAPALQCINGRCAVPRPR